MKQRQSVPAAVAGAGSAFVVVTLLLVWSSSTFATRPDTSIYLPSIRNAPTSTPTAIADHFGVIVDSDLSTVLSETGLTWWYSFNASTPSDTGASVAMISLKPDHSTIKRVPSATLVAAAQAHPGSYWIIGNEPNVPGQDNVSASDYATELNYYAMTIKGADDSAKLVGPNVLNWDSTCTDCGNGFPKGSDWVKGGPGTPGLSAQAMSQIDAWSLHTYPITWQELIDQYKPMTNPTLAEDDIMSMSNYLATLPSESKKPIWDTEFGILWAYDGIDFGAPDNSCAAGSGCVAPAGPYDQAAVTRWMNDFVGWLEANARTYRLQRWFLYTSYGQPESYSTTYAGVSLVQGVAPGASLTESGQLYRSWSLTPVH